LLAARAMIVLCGDREQPVMITGSRTLTPEGDNACRTEGQGCNERKKKKRHVRAQVANLEKYNEKIFL
jgi:hypothetical protein